jgi:hypothetical protein
MPSSIWFKNDGLSGARIGITQIEHYINDGKIWGFHMEDLSMASSDTTYLHIKVGSSDIHWEHEISAFGGRLEYKLYASPTMGTAGTVLNVKNRNCNYCSTAETILYQDSTVSTVGTSLIATRQVFGSTSNQGKTSTSIGEAAQRVFKKNTEYLMAFTANAAAMMFACSGMFLEE